MPALQRVPPNVKAFPASLEPLTPKPVQAASRDLTAAEAAREQARAAASAAREAVSEARTADQQASIVAAREGRTAKAASAPKAEQKADEAQRTLEGHEQLVHDAVDRLLHEVRVGLDEIIERAEAELRQNGLAAANHLTAVEQALARNAEVARLVRELDPDSLEGNEISFLPGWPGRRERDPVPHSARDLLDGLRNELGLGA